MKKLKAKKGIECMACLACVQACSNAYYKMFHPDRSCIRIVEKNGAAKPVTCTQCGLCAKACPAGAITQNAKGVYMISKKLCTGCGQCRQACPFGLMVEGPGGNTTKCIACGLCAKACPMELLEIVES